MEPALHDGDRLLIVTDVGELTRGDIIQFKYPQDQSRFYLKRIVGLPNEKIEIRSGVVLINGQAIDEPYLNAAQNKEESSFPEKVIPPDEFYVLGDNRVNSSDSRYWGTVKRELIIGKYHSKYASEK